VLIQIFTMAKAMRRRAFGVALLAAGAGCPRRELLEARAFCGMARGRWIVQSEEASSQMEEVHA
jgi:hypothetical protein